MAGIKDVQDSLELMMRLHREKNTDYSTEENPFYNFDFAEYIMKQFKNDRDKVFACLVGIKLGRLANLLNKNEPPKNESVEDTLIDDAVYTLIWKADYKRRPKGNGRPHHAEEDREQIPPGVRIRE